MEKKHYFLRYTAGNPERAHFVARVANHSAEYGSFFPHHGASLVIISNRWVHGIGPRPPCLNWCKSLPYISFYEIVREISVATNLKQQ